MSESTGMNPLLLALGAVVVSVLGLGACAGGLVFLGVVQTGVAVGAAAGDAKQRQAELQLESIGQAIEIHTMSQGRPPPDLDGLEEGLLPPRRRADPWGNPVDYTVQGTSFTLRSAGADGALGTADDITR